MQIKPYPLSSSSSRLRYTFTSQNKNNGQKQEKIIEFSEIRSHKFAKLGLVSLFNLGFGDTPDGELIDDKSVTNNGDMETTLRTVAQAAEDFFELHRSAVIFFQGSTPSRTRLYRMMLNKYYDDISIQFDILGICDNGLKKLKKGSSVKYKAFLVKLRQQE
ncbi:DUF6934 family protein [Pasteurella oralis]|uniref:DUF6934 family protein n=1 Tax=Pasteurella oralis TaxID=1071947 RepID=UPI003AF48420